MRARLLFQCVLLLACGWVLGEDTDALPVDIAGSSAAARPMGLMVPILRDRGIRLRLSAETSSSASIALVGEGKADIALSTRAVTGEDRAAAPQSSFHEFPFGVQALVLIVPKDVWAAGVHALNREQIRRIYERDITNWMDVGGENRPIKFFNPEEGHGTWEYFATWLYGEQRKAPLGEGFETVADSEEARNIVEFNAGSLSIAHPDAANGKEVFALAIRNEKGRAVEPTTKNIRDGLYPFQRTLFMITGIRPVGAMKKVVEFVLSPDGQALVKKSEVVPIEDQ